VTFRRLLTVLTAMALLAVAGLGISRSRADTGSHADQVAASLRCPSCEGERVADSRSPVAAAMREVIAQQLTAGRSPDEVRDWFVQRYGSEILADPPTHGIGNLLWILPGFALLAGLVLAVRAVRRRANDPPTIQAPSSQRARIEPGRARRVWDLVAVTVVAMVALVAVASTRSGSDASPPPAASPTSSASADPVTQQVNLAESLEQQGQYATAAEVYRAAAAANPDPRLRLRLAFVLIRAGRPAEAVDVAHQVLAARPADPDAVLVSGLAERAAHSPAAAGTLRRFLRLAPDHPAAAQVRRLLTQGTR
jgi:cytochrome c-type biogenesis protein CcmH